MSSPGGKEKVKRGYRACLHCRSRKAKCDLGDIDAPSDPPCSRCKRESRECVFAPSRRGGNNSKRRKDSIDTTGDNEDSPYGAWKQELREAEPEGSNRFSASYNPRDFYPGTKAIGDRIAYPPFPRLRDSQSVDYTEFRNYSSSLQDLLRSPQSQTNPYPILGHNPSPGQMDLSPNSNIHRNSSTHRNSMGHRPSEAQTPSPKRRRLHLNPPLHAADPSSIVVADMQNESDALHILALASGQAGKERERNEDRNARSASRASERASEPGLDNTGPRRDLRDYALVKLGIATVAQITLLAERFFKYRHHLFPMVPSAIIPRSPEQLATFAHKERYLLAAIVIIASRHASEVGMREVHDRTWGVFRGWLSDIQCLGAPPTIGLVEALLLLAENLPRDPTRNGASNESNNPHLHAIGFGDEVHGAENRQAWALIGMAIRNAYGLGIDKLALKLFPEAERTLELERARLAWTYCYLFDRHVSLRLGLAFWSRGPAAVCFQGFSSSAQTGPAAAAGNFPFLREIKADASPEQEDLASLVQAYLELTQLMSNAHDVLYPNAARTRSLVVYGEYFKYLDELARSLDGFKVLWQEKKWNTFPLTDAVWAMFYYVQLYICAFSFQAHVERAAMRAEDEYKLLEQQHKANGSVGDLTRPPLSLFPRGAAASPDARYIFQSCDAARTLLHICVDRLSPGGALPFMPNRFLLWFTYAAIVLLKALYSGAMLRADHAETLRLIDRLVSCFSETSKDEDHPAVRYGRQLESLKKKLSGIDADAPSPTGGHTVPLPPIAPRHSESRSNTSVPLNRTPAESPYGQALNWTLPVHSQAPPPVSFAYPNTPNGMPAYVAPPHAQPLSEINIHLDGPGPTVQNDLGFPVLEDWFQVESGNEHNGAVFPGLDLQDFWMKVGPGEAQGGFPFR